MKSRINRIIQKEVEAIQNIPIDGIVQSIIDVLYKRIHQKKGKLIVSGMGKAGQIGMNIATTLSSTGTPAIFLHPSEAQHGDVGIVQENDVPLLISNSGKTREILELNQLVKNLYSSIPMIALTGNEQGYLAKLADIPLFYRKPRRSLPSWTDPNNFYYCYDRGWRYHCSIDDGKNQI